MYMLAASWSSSAFCSEFQQAQPLVFHFLKVLTTRSVAVSIMQLTCGCCTWCRADNLGNPLALLQESSHLPQLWEKMLSVVLTMWFYCSSAAQRVCLLISAIFNDGLLFWNSPLHTDIFVEEPSSPCLLFELSCSHSSYKEDYFPANEDKFSFHYIIGYEPH